MAIRIDFLSNTRSITRDVNTLSDTFDTVSDALEDVARNARRSGDDISDSYDDAARDGERSAERLERAFQEASDRTARATEQGSQHMARNTEEGTRRSSESLRELGSEARANASETFSSFDGSASSFADGVQGTLGGIVSSLGPIGAAAGAAGALGIGLITSAITTANETDEQFRQSVADLATDLIETGNRGSASVGKIVEALKELATTGDDSNVTLAKLNDIANDAEGSYKDLAQAYAGNGRGLDLLIAKYKDQKDALEDSNREAQKGLAYRDRVGGDDPRIKSTQTYIDYLEKARKKQREAAKELKLFQDSGGEAMQSASDAAQKYADSIQESTQEAGGSWEDYTKNGVTNLDKYNDALEKQLSAVEDYADNVKSASSKLSTQALEYIESLGAEAAPLLQSFIDAPLAEQKRTARNWDTIGRQSASSFNASLQNNLPKDVTVPVRITYDATDLGGYLRQLEANPPRLPVSLIPTTVGSGVRVP